MSIEKMQCGLSRPETTPLPPPTEVDLRWYALYIQSNHEKKIEEHLRRRGIEVFLPLYSAPKRWKNRTTVRLQLPLFPNYIFVKILRRDSARVLKVPMVYSIIGNGREALPDAEIEALRSGLHLRQVDPCPYVKAGARARIRSGPLAGLEGIVVRKDDGLRVVLSIDLIMQSVAVHVDANELEPL
jgi:transcription antitermination factor NusG